MRLFTIGLLAAIGVAAAQPHGATAPRPGIDWPQFRGIAARGVAEGAPLTAAWSVAGRLEVRSWQRAKRTPWELTGRS
jgi:hypothetical protein